jgi:4-amino-4-deoxy-L-arabinose transferase-like glycosyltransferase
MLFIFLAVAAILFLAKALITLSVPFSLDYGEGPLLDQSLRLAAGRSIYTSDVAAPPFTISNYPSLFMLIVSPFVKLFGPTLTAGRLIALLSTLATAVFLALIVRTFTEDRLATAATALIFLANPYVVQWAGLMRVDMLALALALSTAALYLLVRWPKYNRSLIAAGLLLVAAVYTRQSYGLAAPLADFVWLWYKVNIELDKAAVHELPTVPVK